MLKPNKDLALMCGLFESGQVRPVVDGPHALDDIAAAFRHFGAGTHRGKVVVVVAESAAS